MAYCLVSPYMTVGRYKICREYDYLFLQGISEYDFCGITKDSVVLDLGACVGGFTIHASRRCKHVYSVEPLFTEILKENLILNNITNCTILPYAIGDTTRKETLSFADVKKDVLFCTFDDLMMKILEKIDFLKCDIEGAEQYVPFELFDNIEAELHDFKNQIFTIYHKRNGVEIDWDMKKI